jgi:hypothetical protein
VAHRRTASRHVFVTLNSWQDRVIESALDAVGVKTISPGRKKSHAGYHSRASKRIE